MTDGQRPRDGRVHFEKSSDGFFYIGTARETHQILVDERHKEPPVGSGKDLQPTPVDLMLASLLACQTAVLTQCLAKARIDQFQIEGSADIDDRSEEGVADEMPEHTGSRIEHVTVDVSLTVPPEFEERAGRCLEVYDQGCIVGQSMKAGIDYTPQTTLNTSSDV